MGVGGGEGSEIGYFLSYIFYGGGEGSQLLTRANNKFLSAVYQNPTHPQVSGVGGLASLAKKDWMNTRLCLTLTYHVNLC